MRLDRIVIDGRSQARGGTGIARYVRELVAGLADLGLAEGRVLCWRSESHIFRDLGLRPWPVPSGRLFRPWQLPPVGLTHGPDFRVLAAPRARRIATVLDLAFIRYPGDFPDGFAASLRSLLERQQRTADLAICISEATEADLVEHFPAFEGKTAVIHLGVGDDWFTSADQHAVMGTLSSFGITRPYLLHTGALVPRKDLPTLVRAWAVLHRRGIELDLVLVGPSAVGWRSDMEEVRSAALEADLLPRLHVVGYVDDTASRHLMAGAAAYVSTSKCEGFGLPVLEAMAAGTPVVATRIPALREVGGDTIFYTDVGDAEGAADAIDRALASRGTGSVDRAKQRARHFSWSRCAAQTLACYRRVLGN